MSVISCEQPFTIFSIIQALNDLKLKSKLSLDIILFIYLFIKTVGLKFDHKLQLTQSVKQHPVSCTQQRVKLQVCKTKQHQTISLPLQIPLFYNA